MAVTPETSFDLAGLGWEEQPSLTFWRNPNTRRIEGTADGRKAVAQAVEAALSIERFRWPITGPYYGMEWSGLIGQDPGYVAAELLRRVREALSADSRIKAVDQFTCTASGESLTASLRVRTVFGDLYRREEVRLA